jgi:hypothetical protein
VFFWREILIFNTPPPLMLGTSGEGVRERERERARVVRGSWCDAIVSMLRGEGDKTKTSFLSVGCELDVLKKKKVDEYYFFGFHGQTHTHVRTLSYIC